MSKSIRILIPILVIVILAILATWWFSNQDTLASPGSSGDAQRLQASGTVEALEVMVAAELSGRVVEVMVDKSELVSLGEPLLRLDDELLQAQHRRAQAAYETAQAGVAAAQTNQDMAEAALNSAQTALEAAQIQHQLTLQAARIAEAPSRTIAWEQDVPDEFEQPNWYFYKHEEIGALEAELDATRVTLDQERTDLETLISRLGGDEQRQLVGRLAQARTAYLVAEQVLERAEEQDDETLVEIAQSRFDDALDELVEAQTEYEDLLSENDQQNLLESRASLAAAQAHYDTTHDQLDQMLTGEESLQVRAAEINVRLAQASVDQAKVGIAQAQSNLEQSQMALQQAQAELELIDLQIEKTIVYAPTSGLVLSRNIQPGEVIQALAPLLIIGRMDDLTITVYVPENRYGQIRLGQAALVSVDSFPNQTFDAVVVRIADRAEFTPRNVQTAEGRQSTVFAVELSLEDTQGKLKPGMPADVLFQTD